jgi:hypothetical protein
MRQLGELLVTCKRLLCTLAAGSVYNRTEIVTKNISAVLSLSFVLAISTSIAYTAAQQAAPEPKVSADQLAYDTVQLSARCSLPKKEDRRC